MSSNLLQIPYVLRHIEKHPNQRILDLGCGLGKYGWLLKNVYLKNLNSFLVGVDVYKPYLLALKRIYDNLVVADLKCLPFQNSRRLFDVSLCIDVIEHLEKSEGRAAIRNIKRITGKIILTTPNVLYLQDELRGNPFEKHKCRWSIRDLKQLGFRVFGIGSRVKPHRFLDGFAYYLPFLAQQLLAIFVHK